MSVKYPSVLCDVAGCSYSLGDVSPYFFIGIAFLVVSSVGFLFVLKSYQRALTTPSGTAS